MCWEGEQAFFGVPCAQAFRLQDLATLRSHPHTLYRWHTPYANKFSRLSPYQGQRGVWWLWCISGPTLSKPRAEGDVIVWCISESTVRTACTTKTLYVAMYRCFHPHPKLDRIYANQGCDGVFAAISSRPFQRKRWHWRAINKCFLKRRHY